MRLLTVFSAAALLIFSIAAANNLSDNLYKVTIQSDSQADEVSAIVKRSDARAILRVSDGYLILAPEADAHSFRAAGIELNQLHGDIQAQQLAIDIRLRPQTDLPYEIVYREEGVTVYRLPDAHLG